LANGLRHFGKDTEVGVQQRLLDGVAALLAVSVNFEELEKLKKEQQNDTEAMGHARSEECTHRQKRAPNPPADVCLELIALSGSTVHVAPLGNRPTASYGAFPPLTKLVHVHIMDSHVGANAPNFPICSLQADAQLRLFSADELGVEAISGGESSRAHERNATAGSGFTDGHVPLYVGELIVGRGRGKSLAQATEDNGNVWVTGEAGDRRLNPAGQQLAVAINKLYVLRIWGDFYEPGKSGIAGPSSSERHTHIELYNAYILLLGYANAIIGRA